MPITGADRPTAAHALTESDLRVPVACVMIALGVGRGERQRRLMDTDGRLAAALGEPTGTI